MCWVRGEGGAGEEGREVLGEEGGRESVRCGGKGEDVSGGETRERR